MQIIAALTSVPKSIKKDDSTVDRLHHVYSVGILVSFIITISVTQYFGTPVNCWLPAEFTGSWTAYINSYCWINNTYYLPFEDDIPHEWEPEKRDEIIYYQWVPFILLAQAAMFYAPSVVWHGLNSKSGVDADNILAAAHTLTKAETFDGRNRMFKLLVNQIHRFVRNRRPTSRLWYRPSSWLSCGQNYGNYLVVLYGGVKLLYIGNIIAQMFFLTYVLKTDFFFYGISAWQRYTDIDVQDANYFINNTVFPKVTMCDFKIRRLGNLHRYTVQCNLPINLFIEKAYMFIWLWMVFLLVITIIDFLTWLARWTYGQDKVRYIGQHLMNTRCLTSRNLKSRLKDFVCEYLKQDGVFLLRMIGHNTNYIAVSEVIASLWKNWLGEKALEAEEEDDLNENTPLQQTPNEDRKLPPYPRPNMKPPLPPKPNSAAKMPSAPPTPADDFPEESPLGNMC